MTDNKALDANAQEGVEKYGSSKPHRTFSDVLVSWAEQDLEEQKLQQGHSKVLNPVLLGIVEHVKRMRIVIVGVAIILPPYLLWALLSRVYAHWDMLLEGKAPAAAISDAMATPVTALIIGTFASFIIVYSALLIGVFSQFKAASDASRDKSMTPMHNVFVDVAKESAMREI